MSTQAYLYTWTNNTNKKWYIDSRTKEECHPNDGFQWHGNKCKKGINHE